MKKGSKHSEQAKIKIRQKRALQIITPEHKLKISKSLIGNKRSLGYKHSKELNRRISDSMKGDKTHLWKGGITRENDRIRTSLEIKLWKKSCLLRDDFTCQKTRQRGGKLVVHHINNFADFPELRTSLDNGITLSREVHIEFHKIYGKKNNTRQQLEEFLLV
jgi:hypothetical protein